MPRDLIIWITFVSVFITSGVISSLSTFAFSPAALFREGSVKFTVLALFTLVHGFAPEAPSLASRTPYFHPPRRAKGSRMGKGRHSASSRIDTPVYRARAFTLPRFYPLAQGTCSRSRGETKLGEHCTRASYPSPSLPSSNGEATSCWKRSLLTANPIPWALRICNIGIGIATLFGFESRRFWILEDFERGDRVLEVG